MSNIEKMMENILPITKVIGSGLICFSSLMLILSLILSLKKKDEKDIFRDGGIICFLWNHYFYSSNDRKTNVHGTKGRRRIGSLERHVIIGYGDTNFGYYIRKTKRKLGVRNDPQNRK